MIAPVIDLHDLRARRAGAIDPRTEMERLIDEAKAEAFREGFMEGSSDGFKRGMMAAAIEAMNAPAPTMLRPRTPAAVQMGGWAS